MTELDRVLTPGVVGESLVLPVTYTAPARSTAGARLTYRTSTLAWPTLGSKARGASRSGTDRRGTEQRAWSGSRAHDQPPRVALGPRG